MRVLPATALPNTVDYNASVSQEAVLTALCYSYPGYRLQIAFLYGKIIFFNFKTYSIKICYFSFMNLLMVSSPGFISLSELTVTELELLCESGGRRGSETKSNG